MTWKLAYYTCGYLIALAVILEAWFAIKVHVLGIPPFISVFSG